jgi:hypothetical protein
VSDEQITALLEDAGRLARIEAKLERIEEKLTAFEKLAGSFVTGPGITKLFKALAGGKGQ